MTPVVAEVGSSASQYKVLAKLAVGGMAEIFLAKAASGAGVERYVVLKRILRERANDAAFVQMFLEEARLAAQLNHPNVAQVYDVGRLGDSYFFTMEYVHGETVRSLIKRARGLRRSLPLGIVLTILTGTAAGLHHAHGRLGLDGRPLGIVHRDVSPSNLMVSYEGSIKVVDFGVAKAENRATETRSGTVKGKISYLSPEQCRTVSVDRRSDLFSLGIVVWEMLTGERLYRRGSDFETMSAIVDEPPAPPSRWRPELPPELDALVLGLLAKDAAARFQSADDVVHAAEMVAASCQLPLSTSALSRFMRELFGDRPEPWLEVEAPDTSDGGTTTGSPGLVAPAPAVISPVEFQLAQVRDLSRQFPSTSESQADAPYAPNASVASRPGTHSGMNPHAGMYETAVSQPYAYPPPPAAYPPVPPTWPDTSTASASGLSSPYPVVRRTPEEAPPRTASSRWPLVLVIGGASLAGVVIAAVVSSSPSASAPAVASVSVDAAVPGGTPDGVVMAVVDAGEAAVAVRDAAALTVAPDAEVVPVPLDAAVAVVTPDAAGAPDLAAEATRAHAAGDSLHAVKLCRGLDARPIACALAACATRAGSIARAWNAKLAPAERAQVIAACKARNIDLTAPAATRPAKPDCKVDPLACQF